MEKIELILPVLGIAFIGFGVLLKNPKIGLYLTLLMLPFSWSDVLDHQLFGIPGMKLPVVLPMVTYGILFMSQKKNKLKREDKVFACLYIIFYIVVILHSLSDMKVMFDVAFGYPFSYLRYFSTYFMRPVLVFLLMYLPVIFCYELKDIKKYTIVLLVSILAASLLVIVEFIKAPKGDFETIREMIGDAFGMHSSNIVNFIVLTLPLTLALGINLHKKIFYVFACVEIIAIGVLFSRGAYVVTLFSIASVLYLLKRRKTLAGLIISLPLVYLALPGMIKNRILTGLLEGNVQDISAGRVDHIWKPIIQEMWNNPEIILFGYGKYGFINSKVYKSGLVYDAVHAHNLYLDIICDGGIFLLVFFMVFFFRYLIRFYKGFKITKDPFLQSILIGVFVSVPGFLIKGFIDGVFWAEVETSMIYVLMGLGLLVTGYIEKENGKYNRIIGDMNEKSINHRMELAKWWSRKKPYKFFEKHRLFKIQGRVIPFSKKRIVSRTDS